MSDGPILGGVGELNLDTAVPEPVCFRIVRNNGPVFSEPLYGEPRRVDPEADDRLGHLGGSVHGEFPIRRIA